MYPFAGKVTRFTNANGKLLVKSLFVEYSKEKGIYTLDDSDRGDIPSLYRLYMEERDVIEFEFARKYFSDYDHWIQLTQAAFFRDRISKWRRELSLKIQSEALAQILAESRKGTKNSFQINRWLTERGWDQSDKRSNRAGRPSKEQVRTEAHRIAQDEARVNEDFERIMSTPSQGNA